MNSQLYGLMALFDDPTSLLAAVRTARGEGFRRIEVYTPFAVEGMPDALGYGPTSVRWFALLGGLVGAASGLALQYYMSAVEYPHNIGGRPVNSWPAFIPVTFEVAILMAAAAAVISMLVLNGLPRLHHPLFQVPQFARASRDRFFLCIRSNDPQFDEESTARFLQGLQPLEVVEVPS